MRLGGGNTRSVLTQCTICDYMWDQEGRYTGGYEPGEVEWEPFESDCPECGSEEVEAI